MDNELIFPWQPLKQELDSYGFEGLSDLFLATRDKFLTRVQETNERFNVMEQRYLIDTVFEPAYVNILASFRSKVMSVSAPRNKKDKSLRDPRAPGRSRANFPARKTDILKIWIRNHADDPYPDVDTKADLASKTGLSYDQVTTWFINERMRQQVCEYHYRKVNKSEHKPSGWLHDSKHIRDTPKQLRCPIMRELMQDPVSLLCGHTFERRAVEEWLKSSESCPFGCTLKLTCLRQNFVLQSRIWTFLNARPKFVLRKRDEMDFKHAVRVFVPKHPPPKMVKSEPINSNDSSSISHYSSSLHMSSHLGQQPSALENTQDPSSGLSKAGDSLPRRRLPVTVPTGEASALLRSLFLDIYVDKFAEEGFDKLADLMYATETDFDALGVKRAHRRRIQQAIAISTPQYASSSYSSFNLPQTSSSEDQLQQQQQQQQQLQQQQMPSQDIPSFDSSSYSSNMSSYDPLFSSHSSCSDPSSLYSSFASSSSSSSCFSSSNSSPASTITIFSESSSLPLAAPPTDEMQLVAAINDLKRERDSSVSPDKQETVHSSGKKRMIRRAYPCTRNLGFSSDGNNETSSSFVQDVNVLTSAMVDELAAASNLSNFAAKADPALLQTFRRSKRTMDALTELSSVALNDGSADGLSSLSQFASTLPDMKAVRLTKSRPPIYVPPKRKPIPPLVSQKNLLSQPLAIPFLSEGSQPVLAPAVTG